MAKTAKTERLYVRIDPETKTKATALFDNMGITVTDAVTMFIQQSLISGGLPFHVDASCKTEKHVRPSQVK